MSSCPLYKQMKPNGTSFYAFPGSAEDISSAYQNENFRMYFSKYVLVNFPKQNINPGTMSNPVYWDFENSFIKANQAVAANYADQLVESLRNYVANHEVTVRDSMLNNTQYFDNLPDFASNNIADQSYFPEILWQEREVFEYRFTQFYQSGYGTYSGGLEIEFQGSTNFREGDKIVFQNISNNNIISFDGEQVNILKYFPAGLTAGDKIILDNFPYSPPETEPS